MGSRGRDGLLSEDRLCMAFLVLVAKQDIVPFCVLLALLPHLLQLLLLGELRLLLDLVGEKEMLKRVDLVGVQVFHQIFHLFASRDQVGDLIKTHDILLHKDYCKVGTVLTIRQS